MSDQKTNFGIYIYRERIKTYLILKYNIISQTIKGEELVAEECPRTKRKHIGPSA